MPYKNKLDLYAAQKRYRERLRLRLQQLESQVAYIDKIVPKKLLKRNE